jgi:hypothetical protein
MIAVNMFLSSSLSLILIFIADAFAQSSESLFAPTFPVVAYPLGVSSSFKLFRRRAEECRLEMARRHISLRVRPGAIPAHVTSHSHIH